MPCYEAPPTHDELAEYNFKKYGIRCTYEEMLKAIACQAMALLEETGLVHNTTDYAKLWYKTHKQQDEEKRLEKLLKEKK